MENNRNWAGIAALILAGLALLVALTGRMGPNYDFSAHWWSGPANGSVQAVPVAPGAFAPQGGPIAPQAAQPAPPVVPPSIGDAAQANADLQAKIAQAQADAQAKIAQAQADAAQAQAKAAQGLGQTPAGKPMPPVLPFKRGPFGFGSGGASRFGSVVGAPFHILGGLVQLLVFVGLLFLVFRFFRRRQQAFARGPAAPPPGAQNVGPSRPPGPPTIDL